MSAQTPNRQRAIEAEGNVLVIAGAGTGKTSTLVERCLSRVCRAANPVSLDRILMVTFTEAAATEMRKRIREELEKKAAAQPQSDWLAEQLALVDTARISTLHSFCLQLVREHFYELNLDPELTVLSAEQARLLARETLDALLQKHYGGSDAIAEAVQQLILEHGRGWDQPVRDLVQQLHEYTQTLSDPAGWFEKELSALKQSQPRHWEVWLREGFGAWRQLWAPLLEAQAPENTNAHASARVLRESPANLSREQIAAILGRIVELGKDGHWPRGTKKRYRDPIANLFDDAEFLQALAGTAGGADPLAEDWNWIRPQMTALLRLAQEFGEKFATAKRELGAVDFHDLEQFALQLLWDRPANGPTAAARYWRERLDLVFVDEYQDINEAQDTILRALGREGAEANRFLVGDVKQSIYRFRLANPRIFQGYAEAWSRHGDNHHVIPLSDNFRSHETILNFVNHFFAALMRREIGGVTYDANASLGFGAPKERAALSAATDPKPHVELHLRLTGKDPESGNGEEAFDADGPADLSSAEMEAHLVALRLRQLREVQYPVWKEGNFKPVDWRDMAVLLRSPRAKAESYAKVFESLGVPLVAARGGFYDSEEVIDLLSLLTLLDNPLQDVPLLAVLRSPLVGLTPNELATIRLAQRHGHFWTVLARFHHQARNPKSEVRSDGDIALVSAQSAWPKVNDFLKSFDGWRRLARQGSLSQCLEAALDETCYEAWLLAQRRGEQRCANVRRLLALTKQFDQFQRQGLFRFLKFVEAQRDAEVETGPALVQTENAVQLMSIHQSKGLEFPIVALAGLGKRFNFDDLKGGVVLDEHYGLCPLVKPPHTGRRYPSLPYWLAKQRQRVETLGEELRLLYVAMTRARDRLILAGTASRKAVSEQWLTEATGHLQPHQITAANSYLDWLGRWLPPATGHSDWTTSGQTSLLEWTIYDEDDTRLHANEKSGNSANQLAPVVAADDQDKIALLRQRLEWRYPFPAATEQPAKTSVSALRRHLREETEDEARQLFLASSFEFRLQPRDQKAAGRLSAADFGVAHHTFLQMVSFDRVGSVSGLQAEAQRLRGEGMLSAEEVAVLDFEALTAFWQSEIGKTILAQRAHAHREIPFTARFSPEDLEQFGLLNEAAALNGEFFVVQGFVDLAVILPEEIWIVDFKTSPANDPDLPERVKFYEPQLKLYALALSRIYRRPVTKSWLPFLSAKKTKLVETRT